MMNSDINNKQRTPLFWANLASIAFFVLLWVGGLISYLFLGGPPDGAAWAAPAFLFTAAIVVLTAMPGRTKSIFWSLLLAGALAWGVEVLGVYTGFPFGGYHYTDILAPAPAGVPLAIGAAWIALMGYTCDVLHRMRIPVVWRPLIGAAWMTAMDLVIDPPAAGPLNYWFWEGESAYYGIPLTNFLGWFGLSAVLLLLLPHRRMQHVLPARGIGIAIMLFFVIINTSFRFHLAAVIGAVIITADFLLPIMRRGDSQGIEPTRKEVRNEPRES